MADEYVDITDYGNDIGDEYTDISNFGTYSNEPVQEVEDPYVSDRSRNFFTNTAAGIGRGVVGLIGLGAESLEALGLNNSVDDWAEKAPEKYDFLKRSESDYNGEGNWFTRALRAVPESTTTSLGAMLPGASAGAALGSGFFGIGAVPGAALGGMLSTLGLFGLGTGHQKYEEALKKGLSHDDAVAYGLKYGTIEGGLESAGAGLDILTAKTGGTILRALTKQGAKGTAREILEKVGKGQLKSMAETQVSEGLTEQLQLDLEGRLDKKYGMGDEASWQDRLETGVTTVAMSLILGGALAESPRAMKRRAQALLESGDPTKMQAGSELIYTKLKEDGDKDLAESWKTYADSYINNGLPINLDGNYVDLADKIQNAHKTTVDDLVSDNPEVRRNAEEKAFKSVGLHPDGTPMTEEEHKEFQDKAAEIFSERALKENQERNKGDEVISNLPSDNEAVLLRDTNGVAGENTVTNTEKLSPQSQNISDRSDITPELKKTEEIFKKQKEEEDALAAKRKRAYDYAMELQDKQRELMLKARDNQEALTMSKEVNDAIAKAKAAHDAWLKKKEQNKKLEEQLNETGRDKREGKESNRRSGTGRTRVGEGSRNLQEAVPTRNESVPVATRGHGKETSKQALISNNEGKGTTLPVTSQESNTEKSVPLAQRNLLKVGDKVGTAPTAQQSVAAKEHSKFEASKEPVVSTEERTASGKKGYIEVTREPVNTLTPEKEVELKQGADKLGNKEKDGQRDVTEIETDDPVLNAIATGNLAKLKQLVSPGKRGGQVSAKYLREVIDKAISNDIDNIDLHDQLRYEADKMEKEVLKRPAPKKTTAWNEDEVTGMATGKSPNGEEVMVAPSSSGKGYSIFTRENIKSKWVEQEGTHRTVTDGMKAYDKQFKDNSGFKKGETKQLSDNHSVTVHSHPDSSYTLHHHKRGNTRFWTIADEKGKRIPKSPQYRSKAKAVETIRKIEEQGVDAMKFNSSVFREALATKRPIGSINNAHELLQNAGNFRNSNTWVTNMAKTLLMKHPEALRNIKVYEVDPKTAFTHNGSVYFGKDLIDRPDLHMHEIVHALTAEALNQNVNGFKDTVRELVMKARKELLTLGQQDILENIKTSLDWYEMPEKKREGLKRDTNGIAYALINEKEFLANIYNNVNFRNALNDIYEGGTGSTIFGKLKKKIMSVLGIKDQSMLEKVFDLTHEIAAIQHVTELTHSQYVDAAAGFHNYVSKDKSVAIIKKLKEQAIKTLKPISIRIEELSPDTARMLRKMDFRIHDQEQQMLNRVTPWKDKYRKLSKEEKLKVDKAWNNYATDPEIMINLMKQHDMIKEFKEVQNVLDHILKRFRGVGLDPYRVLSSYLPRRVKDVNALSAYLSKNPDADGQIAAMLSNKNLTEAEKLEELNRMINQGTFPETALLRPNSLKNRSIKKVNTKMTREFYHSAPDALMSHISDSIEKIETRRLLVPKGLPAMEKRLRSLYKEIKEKGKDAPKRLLDQRDMIEQSINKIIEADDTAISAMLLKEAKGMKDSEVRELVSMIRARLNQKGTRGIVTDLKNIGLITALGSPLSTITQIGDLAWSIHQHGMSNTVKAMFQKKEITKEDLNFDSAIREFQTKGSSKLVEEVLGKTLFSKMEGWMKSVNMQAALNKYRNLSVHEFTKQYGKLFTNSQKVYEDIKAGKKTEDIRYLLFNEIADMQPVAMSEMPEYYLTAGNGRIFYTLKSYSIKTMSNIFKEAFDSTKSNPTKVRNAMKLAFIIVMANAGTDLLKDMLLGREADPGDEVMDNLLKLFMLNKYSINNLKRHGPSQLVIDQLAPPVLRAGDDMFMDVASWINSDKENTFKTLRNVPVFGKLSYEWGTTSAKKSELRRLQNKANKYKSKRKPVPLALRRRIAELKRKIKR